MRQRFVEIGSRESLLILLFTLSSLILRRLGLVLLHRSCSVLRATENALSSVLVQLGRVTTFWSRDPRLQSLSRIRTSAGCRLRPSGGVRGVGRPSGVDPARFSFTLSGASCLCAGFRLRPSGGVRGLGRPSGVDPVRFSVSSAGALSPRWMPSGVSALLSGVPPRSL